MIQSTRLPRSISSPAVLMFGFMNCRYNTQYSWIIAVKYDIHDHTVWVDLCVAVVGNLINTGLSLKEQWFNYCVLVWVCAYRADRRELNKEVGQSAAEHCPNFRLPVYLMMQCFILLYHTAAASLPNAASCNSISLLPLPIVYFMDPLWSIKSCCFCQHLTVLCVCHSELVKR